LSSQQLNIDNPAVMTPQDFKQALRNELESDILPYWRDQMTDPNGGFYGRRDGNGQLVADAPKGLILNARILWTFASAYRITGDSRWLESATRAKTEIIERFCDPVYGGAWWSLDAQGRPLDRKKQFYAIAFAIYGLAEYHRATGDDQALQCAISLFHSIEEHSHDDKDGGYIEACAEDWSPIADMRLSDKDRNDAKTMNTHLHILEGYTALYRVWKDKLLAGRLRELIDIFLGTIAGPDGHLRLFFDEQWQLHGDMRSYGHDIEASWLLCEAAEVLGDDAPLSRKEAPGSLLERVEAACAVIADAAVEGLSEDGGMIYEYSPETSYRDDDRHWWVQAETVVGCWNRYQLGGGPEWCERAYRCWEFIRTHLLCPDGEWYWSDRHGAPNLEDDRAGFWKCPYHNGRMCMEIIERI